jgi:hypothetical protein
MNIPPIDFPFSLIFGICLGFGVCLAVCVGRILSNDPTQNVDADWLLELSTERYRPMLRLLGDEDVAFLRAQPGFRPSMAAKLRAQRCQILSAYLRSLDLDFRWMCAAIKVLMVQSRQDRPDLARTLFRYQVSFAAGILMARVQLMFYRLGLGKVDVAGLVALFDITRVQLRNLAPAISPASL